MSTSRIYYGWVVLVASMALDVCSSPGHSTGVSLFIDDLINATGSSRATVSAAYSGSLFVSSLLTPIPGWLLDHHGVRPVAAFAMLGVSAGLLGLSRTRSLGTFAASLALLRFAGPECVAICVNTCLYRWFVRRRGFVAMVRSVGWLVVMAFPDALAWLCSSALPSASSRAHSWALIGQSGLRQLWFSANYKTLVPALSSVSAHISERCVRTRHTHT